MTNTEYAEMIKVASASFGKIEAVIERFLYDENTKEIAARIRFDFVGQNKTCLYEHTFYQLDKAGLIKEVQAIYDSSAKS
jgi:hypothetical protein